MSGAQASGATYTDHEREQVERANASGKTPVVFVHGLWLLPSSWDRWAEVFEEAGFVALTPSWPDDPETVDEANMDPDVFAGKTVGMVADHMGEVIGRLDSKPAVIGHSIGGLLTQIIAGRGLSRVSVAIDPGPFRGVLPLPYTLLKALHPVWGNPLNHHRAVPLTFEQFQYGFANTVSVTRKPGSYTRPTRFRPRARRSSRVPPRTSTRAPKPRLTRGTPIAAHC
jgi:non-heme chloroperoxidase